MSRKQRLQDILEELQAVSDCNEEFMKVLLEFGALGITDVTELNAKRERYGPQEQTKRLYQILLTRNQDQDFLKSTLIHAFSTTKQNAAVKLLIQGNVPSSAKSQNQGSEEFSPEGNFPRRKKQSVSEGKRTSINVNDGIDLTGPISTSENLLYTGTFNGRDVVIKKIIFKNINHATKINDGVLSKARELLEGAKHKNVLHYLQIKVDTGNDVLSFIRDNLQFTLEDWIDSKGECILPAKIMTFDLMAEATRGLAHLHSKGIIHTSIKPQNVLLSASKNNTLKVKLADFSILRNITDDGNLSPLNGWVAPEILDSFPYSTGNQDDETLPRITWTYAADIYSLGYVYYYILSGGKLPFSINNGRVIREKKFEFSSEYLQSKQSSTHLIRMMLAVNPTKRPPAQSILSYHIFLPMHEKLGFLLAVHKVLHSKEKLATIRQCKEEIDSYGEKIWEKNELGWRNAVCHSVQAYMDTKKLYRSKMLLRSVFELINFIAKLYEERDTLDPSMRQALGTDPTDFMFYWKTRFPFLIHYIWLVFQKVKNDHSLKLQKFYPVASSDYVFTQMIICDKISYDPSSVLGRGNGTVVFKGHFDHREVAVKRIDKKLCSVANPMDEIDMLLRCDKHENITKYFFQEQDDLNNVILIALELCDFNLEDWVDSKGKCIPNMKNIINPRNILLQVTKGLAHLHEKGVVHRDLKPGNILLQVISRNKTLIKISDFGVSKLLPEGRNVATRRTSTGSLEWMATEITNQGSSWQMSTATDIFAAGCIFYYVITWGDHPFRDPQDNNPIRTQCNIMMYNSFLDLQKTNHLQSYLGDIRLIQRMISRDPELRPPASAILKHHIFWSKQTCIDFIASISNVIKLYEKLKNTDKTTHALRLCMDGANENYCKKLYTNWGSRVTSEVKKYVNVNIHRDYDTSSILGLLPAVRNIAEHYDTHPEWLRNELGKHNNLYDYWQAKFPFLIDNVWANFEKLRDDESWKIGRYYCDSYNFDYYNSNDDVTIFTDYVERKLKQSLTSVPMPQLPSSRKDYGMYSGDSM